MAPQERPSACTPYVLASRADAVLSPIEKLARADCFELGLGVERDYPKAFQLLDSAASGGHPEAQYRLALYFIEGRAVIQSPIHAVSLLEELAKAGHVEAQFVLGDLLISGAPGSSEDLPANPALAHVWYSRAAKQGHRRAQLGLARECLLSGDVTAGLQWLDSVDQYEDWRLSFDAAALALEVGQYRKAYVLGFNAMTHLFTPTFCVFGGLFWMWCSLGAQWNALAARRKVEAEIKAFFEDHGEALTSIEAFIDFVEQERDWLSRRDEDVEIEVAQIAPTVLFRRYISHRLSKLDSQNRTMRSNSEEGIVPRTTHPHRYVGFSTDWLVSYRRKFSHLSSSGEMTCRKAKEQLQEQISYIKELSSQPIGSVNVVFRIDNSAFARAERGLTRLCYLLGAIWLSFGMILLTWGETWSSLERQGTAGAWVVLGPPVIGFFAIKLAFWILAGFQREDP